MTIYKVYEKISSESNAFEPIITWIAAFHNLKDALEYAGLLNKYLAIDGEFYKKEYFTTDETL